MADPKRYTVTAALPYANGPVHIGHLAGCYLPADIYVRYLRRRQKDVKFICGSDEHGVAVMMKARQLGISVKEVVDEYHGMIKESFEKFGIGFDIYSRTSNATHHEMAQEFFLKLYEKDIFIEKETDQYYDEEAEQFLADRYIEGECPNCGNPDAYGDQCERCGSTLSPMELKNPRSRLSGSQPVIRKTKHWFLPLDRLSEKIKSYVESHSDWKPNVYGQCKSWLDDADGLMPRSMTRDLNWGVDVPLEGAEGKKLYVWFDAPIGYISATKELLGDDWKKYWQDEETSLIHFIGKDNIVFHCIIFPSMLMEHGDYILPDQVPANEFLNLEGRKISTSKNWAVWLHEYLDEFDGKEDVLRYTLCATAPEAKDNDFTWKYFQTRNNSELVAILGNFVNRVMVLSHKYYSGKVPRPGDLSKEDKELLQYMSKVPAEIGGYIEQYKFRLALTTFMDLARAGNKYLADQEPWKKQKTDPERTKTIMYCAVQVCSQLAQLCEPFMPFTADKFRRNLNLQLWPWQNCETTELIEPDHTVERGELLFEKIEDSVIEKQLEKLQKNLESSENKEKVDYPEMKEEISFDDFSKLDLRTGKILEAEPVPKTDKLMKLSVDLGFEQRTIVSGIAQYFKDEELPGKQVVVVANLAPKKLRGVLSHGMVLMAENADGSLQFVQSDGSVDPGMVVS